MRQFGGAPFTPDAGRCTLDDPRNVAALQFCVDLIRRDHTAPPPENIDAWIGFRQGKVATAFEGIYMLADLQKNHGIRASSNRATTNLSGRLDSPPPPAY